MPKALALLFSPKDKPRLMYVATLNEMAHQAEQDGTSFCMVASPQDTTVALHGGILVCSVGDMGKSLEENAKTHYKALTLGHLCLKHGEFTSDIEIDGRFRAALEVVAELACRAYAEEIADKMDSKEARALMTEMLETAAQFINCGCIAEHITAVTGLGFHLDATPHKPEMMN